MRKIKLTGISTPFGGISWNLEKSDIEIAKDLINFLEDRRVLSMRFTGNGRDLELVASEEHRVCTISTAPHEFAIKSVMEIRRRLRDDLERVKPKSKLVEPMKNLQRACRDFLGSAENGKHGETYKDDLEKLRITFSKEMLFIAERLGYAIEAKNGGWYNEEQNRKAFSEGYFHNNDYRLVPIDEEN